MAGSSLDLGRAVRSYVVGFVLALLLTAVPFGLVATQALERAPTLAVIAVLAIVQIAVHLRYFLHVDLKPSSRPVLLMMAFAAILIFIMVGGSLWIMFDLHERMMGAWSVTGAQFWTSHLALASSAP